MRIIVDTNVVLDVLMNRAEFFQPSYDVLKLSAFGDVEGYVTASSVTDIYYMVYKNCKDRVKSLEAIRQLLQLVKIADVTQSDIAFALETGMVDYEDAVQSTVAKRQKVDYIVTRNDQDFIKSEVPALTPQDFLEKFFKA